jgi:hypothetical protein
VTYEPAACVVAVVPSTPRVTVQPVVPAPAVTSMTSRWAVFVGPSWTTILNWPVFGNAVAEPTVMLVATFVRPVVVVEQLVTGPFATAVPQNEMLFAPKNWPRFAKSV